MDKEFFECDEYLKSEEIQNFPAEKYHVNETENGAAETFKAPETSVSENPSAKSDKSEKTLKDVKKLARSASASASSSVSLSASVSAGLGATGVLSGIAAVCVAVTVGIVPVSGITQSTVDEPPFHQIEQSVEESVESSVEESVESSVEESVESSVEESVESSVEESVESSVEESAESSVEESVESSVEESTESSVEESTESSVEESTESSVEESTESSVEESTESSVEESTESSVEESVESSVEESVESSVEESAESSVEESTESSVEESTESSVEESTESSVEESTESSVEESTESSVEESAESSVEESAESSVEESTESSVEESTESSVEESTESSVEESAESTVELEKFELFNDGYNQVYNINGYSGDVISYPVNLYFDGYLVDGDTYSVRVFDLSGTEVASRTDLTLENGCVTFVGLVADAEYTFRYYVKSGGEETPFGETVKTLSLIEFSNLPDWYCQTPNPGDALVTYNGDGTSNVYLYMNVQQTDYDMYYKVYLADVVDDGETFFEYTSKENVAILRNIPAGRYSIKVGVLINDGGTCYSVYDLGWPSGTIVAGLDEKGYYPESCGSAMHDPSRGELSVNVSGKIVSDLRITLISADGQTNEITVPVGDINADYGYSSCTVDLSAYGVTSSTTVVIEGKAIFQYGNGDRIKREVTVTGDESCPFRIESVVVES